jgi:hypothetical protein
VDGDSTQTGLDVTDLPATGSRAAKMNPINLRLSVDRIRGRTRIGVRLWRTDQVGSICGLFVERDRHDYEPLRLSVDFRWWG